MYLKIQNEQSTKQYTLTDNCAKPYINVGNQSCLPLTTSTTSGLQLKVSVNGVGMCRGMEYQSESASATYLTSAVNSNGLSNTTALTRQSTSSTSYLTRPSTSGESYITRPSTSGTSYLTSAGTGSFILRSVHANVGDRYVSTYQYLPRNDDFYTTWFYARSSYSSSNTNYMSQTNTYNMSVSWEWVTQPTYTTIYTGPYEWATATSQITYLNLVARNNRAIQLQASDGLISRYLVTSGDVGPRGSNSQSSTFLYYLHSSEYGSRIELQALITRDFPSNLSSWIYSSSYTRYQDDPYYYPYGNCSYTYYTSVSPEVITTGTSALTKASTYSTSYLTRPSTSQTSYLTRPSTSGYSGQSSSSSSSMGWR